MSPMIDSASAWLSPTNSKPSCLRTILRPPSAPTSQSTLTVSWICSDSTVLRIFATTWSGNCSNSCNSVPNSTRQPYSSRIRVRRSCSWRFCPKKRPVFYSILETAWLYKGEGCMKEINTSGRSGEEAAGTFGWIDFGGLPSSGAV